MSHGSLFFLSLLLSFYPEADSGKRKAAIRVTERSAGIKTQIVFVFLAQFPRNAHLVAAIWNFDAFIFVI